MTKKVKRMFNAAAVCCIILAFGSLMSLAAAVSSSGRFTFFAAVCIMNFLTLVYLTVILFRKKEDMQLGFALGANAFVSLLTVCFFFSWQELFICLTFTVLCVNYFVKDRIGQNKKYFLPAVLLPAACILIYTIIGFVKNINQNGNGQLAFDMVKWAYYFSPFAFAVFNAAAADIIAIIINDAPSLKNEYKLNKISLIPAAVLIITSIITAVIAGMGNVVLGSKADTVQGILLIVSDFAAIISAAAFPFLYSFIKPKKDDQTEVIQK